MAYRLRTADEQEIRAATGLDYWVALETGRLWSDPCITVLHKSRPVLVFGVVRHSNHPPTGGVWMLATDGILDIQFTFLRHCRAWLSRAVRGCEVTWNVVDCRNRLHVRWLHWMGYKMLRVIPHYGVERRRFIEFARLEVK